MRLSKAVFAFCIAVLFVTSLLGRVRSMALSPQQNVVADGGAPVPDPWLAADGGAPVPDPWLVADGGAPVPDPWLVADGGAPVPDPWQHTAAG